MDAQIKAFLRVILQLSPNAENLVPGLISNKNERNQLSNNNGESNAPMIKQNIEMKEITPVIEDKREEKLDGAQQ